MNPMTPDEVVKVLKLSVKIVDGVMKTQMRAGVKFTHSREFTLTSVKE